jgi:8-oxo-dGTP diphosphatase
MMKRCIDVVCGFFEKDGKVLICKRKPGIKNAGKWEFPGGKVIDGESMLRGLRREIREELGVEINISDNLSLLKRVDGKFNLLTYRCTALSPITESTDHDELLWVIKEDLSKYDLLDGDKLIVSDLKEKGVLNS